MSTEWLSSNTGHLICDGKYNNLLDGIKCVEVNDSISNYLLLLRHLPSCVVRRLGDSPWISSCDGIEWTGWRKWGAINWLASRMSIRQQREISLVWTPLRSLWRAARTQLNLRHTKKGRCLWVKGFTPNGCAKFVLKIFKTHPYTLNPSIQ